MITSTREPKLTTELSPRLLVDLLAATTGVASLPEFIWLTGDDKCDCTYQRIGFYTNPYLAVTEEVRLCCLAAEFKKMFPQVFRTTQAYWDLNAAQWVEAPAPWDSQDAPMPVSLWHRQIARKTGKTVAEVREEYRGREADRPKAMSHRRRRGPSLEARKAARDKTLRQSGWIVGTETIPIMAGDF